MHKERERRGNFIEKTPSDQAFISSLAWLQRLETRQARTETQGSRAHPLSPFLAQEKMMAVQRVGRNCLRRAEGAQDREFVPDPFIPGWPHNARAVMRPRGNIIANE